jgi:predicted methyltransferase
VFARRSGAVRHLLAGPWPRSRSWIAALGLYLACQTRPDQLPQHFPDPQAKIVEFEAGSREAWQMPDRVVRSLGISSKAAVIADIGAGSGYFSRRLAAQVPEGRVYAVDVDDAFQQFILQNRESWGTPNIEPRLAFYDDPALPDGEIDLVFLSNTYPYIRERAVYLQRIHQALRPGGRVAIVDFRQGAKPPPEAAAPDPKHRLSAEEVRAEMQQAGFVFEREETYLPHQYFLIFTPAR